MEYNLQIFWCCLFMTLTFDPSPRNWYQVVTSKGLWTSQIWKKAEKFAECVFSYLCPLVTLTFDLQTSKWFYKLLSIYLPNTLMIWWKLTDIAQRRCCSLYNIGPIQTNSSSYSPRRAIHLNLSFACKYFDLMSRISRNKFAVVLWSKEISRNLQSLDSENRTILVETHFLLQFAFTENLTHMYRMEVFPWSIVYIVFANFWWRRICENFVWNFLSKQNLA